MNKNGPILIIEDDEDDRFVFDSIFKQLDYPNEVLYFSTSLSALQYIEDMTVKPFLIISDINMPPPNGFELRHKIFNDPALKAKCIPYLFLTTDASMRSVIEAYSMSIQGYFVKPSSVGDIRSLIKRVVEYWQLSVSPDEALGSPQPNSGC